MDRLTATKLLAVIAAASGGTYLLSDGQVTEPEHRAPLVYEKPRGEIFFSEWVKQEDGSFRRKILTSMPRPWVLENSFPDETYEEAYARLLLVAQDEVEARAAVGASAH